MVIYTKLYYLIVVYRLFYRWCAVSSRFSWIFSIRFKTRNQGLYQGFCGVCWWPRYSQNQVSGRSRTWMCALPRTWGHIWQSHLSQYYFYLSQNLFIYYNFKSCKSICLKLSNKLPLYFSYVCELPVTLSNVFFTQSLVWFQPLFQLVVKPERKIIC